MTGNQVECQRNLAKKVRLSEVKNILVPILKEHPLNAFLPNVEEEDFNLIVEDIKLRGILIPLIAKSDFTILTGHKRLKAARLLEMTELPVQIVLSEIDKEQEREILFKDNILRRQLRYKDKREIVSNLYHDEIFSVSWGGDRKSSLYKNQTANHDLISLPMRISREIGFSIATANRILADIRREAEQESSLETQRKFNNQLKKIKKIILDYGCDFKPVAISSLRKLLKELEENSV